MENTKNSLNIYQKLANAKKSFGIIKKTVQGYGYKYADLGQVIEAIQLPLLDSGLDFMQHIVDNRLITNLINIETQEVMQLIEFDIVSANIAKANDIQQFGGGITYLRRYSLLTAFGLATEDDDAKDTKNNILNTKKDVPELTIQNKKQELLNIINERKFSDAIVKRVNELINNEKSTFVELTNALTKLREKVLEDN